MQDKQQRKKRLDNMYHFLAVYEGLVQKLISHDKQMSVLWERDVNFNDSIVEYNEMSL